MIEIEGAARLNAMLIHFINVIVSAILNNVLSH